MANDSGRVVLICAVLGISGFARADPVIVVDDPHSAPRIQIDFDSVVAQKVTLGVHNVASGPLELYPASASEPDRAKLACTVQVHDGSLALDASQCSTLLAPLWAGQAILLGVSKPGSALYSTIAFDAPPAYRGAKEQSSISVPSGTGPTLPTLSLQVPTDPRCYFHLKTWLPAQCNNQVTADAPTQAMVAAALHAGDTVSLYVKTADADGAGWRTITLTQAPPSDQHAPPPSSDLEQRCRQALPSPVATEVYYACIDAYPSLNGAITLYCDGAGTCKPVGELVEPNRSFVVRVFTDPELLVKVALAGTPGYTAGINNPKAAGGVVARPTPVWNFGPRKPGAATLTVSASKLKPDGTSSEVAHVDVPYSVQTLYKLSVRLGLGFVWEPYAKTVGIATTPDGQRYSAILEGSDHGLYQTEIVSGVTYFYSAVRQDSLDLTVGVGLRIGVLSVGSDVKAFSSLMGGFEAVAGPDFSIGVFGGVARHDSPNNDYVPGRLIPSGVTAIPMHTSATPCFAIVVNFNPGVLKGVGVSP